MGKSSEAPRPAPGVYKYYSTQRPVDIGTFPKTENGPVDIVISISGRAWRMAGFWHGAISCITLP